MSDPTPLCTAANCLKPVFCRGLCKNHSAYRWRQENPEAYKAVRAREYAKTREAQLKRHKDRYDPIAKKKYNDAYADKNREATRSSARKYYRDVLKGTESFRAAARHNAARYRANKHKATPPWADLEAIRAFYADLPPGHHVDHIVPLAGRNVCGLHVLENLQYLPAEVNRRKSNKVNGVNN